MSITDIDLMFLTLQVVAGLGEYCTAYVLIVRGLPFVRISDPKLIAICKIVKNPSGPEEVVHRRRDVLVDGAIGSRRVHDGLLIVQVLIQRKQESCLPARSKGATQRAFIKLPAL